MKNREMLKELDVAISGLEEKIKGRQLTEAEIKEEIINTLQFVPAIYIPNINIGEMEERSDYLRVTIQNEVYPDLIVGYGNVIENEECNLCCEVEYIDMVFENE